MPHTEIKTMQDEIANKYHVSPTKIRKAGLKEMLELEQEEQAAAEGQRNMQKKGENLVQAYRNI